MDIYIGKEGQVLGPFFFEEIARRLEAGRIDGTERAWHEGLDGWVGLREIMRPGHPPTSTQSQQVRVFISSTFLDMQEERDVLVKQVFPELRRRCTERGVDFVEVDLRWGVTEEEAENGEVLPICLREIELCRPYFIGLLGERYGWVPSQLPGELVEEQAWLASHRDKSMTEMEILYGVLNNPDTAGRAFFYFRDPGYSNEHGGDHAAEDSVASQKLGDLKGRILSGATSVLENYANPEVLGQHVMEDLWRAIDQEHPVSVKLSPFERETRDHESFGESRQRIYIAREADMQRLDEHAAQEKGPPLVIHGESGCGKSALLANWLARYRRANPQARTFVHYLGSTADSADPWQMIHHLLQAFKEWGAWEEDIPVKREELQEMLPLALASAGQKAQVVIVFDGLNQVVEEGRDLRWLPWHSPPGVHLICSAIPGECLDLLEQREWQQIEVALLAEEHQREVALRYQDRFRKKLPEALLNELVKAPATANPLYLKVLLDELRVFGEHEQLAQKLRWYLEATTPVDLYDRMLTRLEGDYEGKRKGLVSEALSLIWASRNGLKEGVLLELLGGEDEPALPRAYWAPLHLALQESLALRGGRLTFFHDYLRLAVEKRYAPDQVTRQSLHLRLANYFGQGDEVTDRMAEELPWQLAEAEAWDYLQPWLTHIPMFLKLHERDWLELWGYWRKIIDATTEKPHVGTEYSKTFLSWMKTLDSSKIDQDESDIEKFEALQSTLRAIQGFLLLIGEIQGAGFFAKEYLKVTLMVFPSEEYQFILTDPYICLGDVHSHKGEYDQAMEYYQKVLTIYADELGSDDPRQTRIYSNIGRAHLNRGDYDQALEFHLKGLKICSEQGGPEHPSVAIAYFNIGQTYLAMGEYGQALEYHNRALTIVLKQLGPDHLTVATHYNDIGTVYLRKGEHDLALEFLGKSLDIRLRHLGENHPDVDEAFNNIGSVHSQKGEHDQALEYFQKALHSAINNLGKNHPRASVICNNIGGELLRKGEYDQGLTFFRKSLEIKLEQLGPDHPSVATSYNNIGQGHERNGEHDQALEYYQKSLAIALNQLGPDHPHVAPCYGNIGNIHGYKDEYDQALEYYQKSLSIELKQLGPDHPDVALNYHNIGMMHRGKGDYDRAIEYLSKSLAIFSGKLGMDHLKTKTVKTHLDRLTKKMEKYRSTEDLRKSLETVSERLGPDHPDVATLCGEVGLKHKSLGEYDQALEYYYRAMAIALKQLGPDHPDLAISYNNIGNVYGHKGENERALEFYQKAMPIWLNKLGKDHPFLITLYFNIGLTHEKLSEYDQALEYYERSLSLGLKLSTELSLQDDNSPKANTLRGNIGRVNYKKGEYDLALEFYQKSLVGEIRQYGEDNPVVAQRYNDLAFAFKAKKNFPKALEYWEKSYAIFVNEFGWEDQNARDVKANLNNLAKKMEEQ